MTEYRCSYCEEELTINKNLVMVKDGKLIIYLHDDCVPFFSGGLKTYQLEKECGVELIGEVVVGAGGAKRVYGFENGKLHNEYGPAVERPRGTKEWWIDDHRHRIDGPAIEWDTGTKEWWLRGLCLTKEDWREKIKNLDNLDILPGFKTGDSL